MDSVFWIAVQTSWGKMLVAEGGKGILATTLPDSNEEKLYEHLRSAGSRKFIQNETPILIKAKVELLQYFDGHRSFFDLPLDLRGTPFQTKVWTALTSIPYGSTWSYQDVANSIGSPKATRAVGMANHDNPLPIVIPCHRVIGKDGSLTGFGGGIALKKRLLEFEASHLGRPSRRHRLAHLEPESETIQLGL